MKEVSDTFLIVVVAVAFVIGYGLVSLILRGLKNAQLNATLKDKNVDVKKTSANKPGPGGS